LLGARPVTDMGPWSHYRKLLGQIEVELPDATVAESLHQLIYDIKARGNTPELREAFAAILDAMESDVVLLACTELPLVYAGHAHKEVVDVTDLVARKLARLTLSNEASVN
jgi:aspartate racemase